MQKFLRNFIILFYLCTRKQQKALIMNIQQLFEAAGRLSPEMYNLFLSELSQAVERRNPFRGFQIEEVEAFMALDEEKMTCACGSPVYNCICYPDAE